MNKDILTAVAGAAAVSIICYGIAQLRPQTAPPRVVPGLARTPDKVVMHVNGEPVTERELFLFLNEAPPQMQAFLATAARDQLASEYVKLKVLEQEGKRLGAASHPEVKGRLEYSRMKETASFALQNLARKTDDAVLRAEYEKQRGTYESMDLSHILIAYAGGAVPPRAGDPPAEAAAMQKAEAVTARLRRGADFAQAAAEVSDDQQSAAQGGMLGSIGRSALPLPLAEVAFALQPGEVSRPVKSEFGIHIFKGGEKSTQSFEDLKGQLQERHVLAEVEKLRKSAKVTMDPEYFKKSN